MYYMSSGYMHYNFYRGIATIAILPKDATNVICLGHWLLYDISFTAKMFTFRLELYSNILVATI